MLSSTANLLFNYRISPPTTPSNNYFNLDFSFLDDADISSKTLIDNNTNELIDDSLDFDDTYYTDARTLPQSIDSKTPRKSTSQGDGMSFSTNSNKKGNKPALMEAFMGPTASWDSRSSSESRNKESRWMDS